MEVDVCLLGELALRAKDGQPRRHGARSACVQTWTNNVFAHAQWVDAPVPTSRPVWKMSTRQRGFEKASCTAAKRRGA